MDFPIYFAFCPNCDESETIANLACEGETSLPEEAHHATEQVITVIQNPATIITLTVKVLISYYDVCVRCGTRYCTKAEIGALPRDLLLKQMGMAQALAAKNK